LSKVSLTDTEGLSFVPTPFIDRKGIQDSGKDLGRRLEIKFFFRTTPKAYVKNAKTFLMDTIGKIGGSKST